MNSSHTVIIQYLVVVEPSFWKIWVRTGPSSPISGLIITKIFKPQSTVWNAHWCFLTRSTSICLNHLVGTMAKVTMPFVGWPTCCILRSHLSRAVDDHSQFKARPCDYQRAPQYKWMMVASKEYGRVTSWNAYSHLWGNLPPKKGTSKTLASLKSCLIFRFMFTLLRRKLDLEGPMFVCHGHRQSSNQNKNDSDAPVRTHIYRV